MTSNLFILTLPIIFYHSQIGTNNCVAHYRTLGGGIGGSPTLTHSSDYVDDDDDELTDNTSVLNGVDNSSADCSTAIVATAVKQLKGKQNNVVHLTKSSVVSYQKASIHYEGF